MMAKIRSTRVQPNYSFVLFSMDYGGRFIVKESHRKGAKSNKVYLALMNMPNCEDSPSQNIEWYICSPWNINRNMFRMWQKLCWWSLNLFSVMRRYMMLLRVELCVDGNLAPIDPNFVEVSETIIKSAKTHLRKVIENQIFIMDEFNTRIVRIEGILILRPITSVSTWIVRLNAKKFYYMTIRHRNSTSEIDIHYKFIAWLDSS